MGNKVIQVNNVTKKFNLYKKDLQKIFCVLFGKKPPEVLVALEDVSFEIAKGERVALLGLMGSGRSTLISISAGIMYPSKGTVKVHGRTNAMISVKAGLEKDFSCRENVYLKGNVVGLPKEVIDEHIDEILEFAELEDYADLPLKRAPKSASSMISIAVHVLMDCDLLIIDNAIKGGGKYSKEKCEEKLKKYIEDHPDMAVFVVATQGKFVREICSRGIVLEQGKVTFDGPFTDAVKLHRELLNKIDKGQTETDKED
ncbi:MAG: ATP-binding cassette domain-containing protein [Firmicutes bacterium]|nr:ATP-binding cassette domain-containing protein [Bacillota bacterium]